MRKSPRRTPRSSARRVRSPLESAMGCKGRGAIPGDLRSITIAPGMSPSARRWYSGRVSTRNAPCCWACNACHGVIRTRRSRAASSCRKTCIGVPIPDRGRGSSWAPGNPKSHGQNHRPDVRHVGHARKSQKHSGTGDEALLSPVLRGRHSAFEVLGQHGCEDVVGNSVPCSGQAAVGAVGHRFGNGGGHSGEVVAASFAVQDEGRHAHRCQELE